MKFFVTFDMDALDLPYAVKWIKTQNPAISNLYMHDGAGNAYQDNRKCTQCGSRFWKDPSDAPASASVQCVECGKLHDIQ